VICIRVLICGDRNWNHPEEIDAFVKSLPKDTIIIEGECRGADIQSRLSATKYGLEVERYPANWEKYGKGAGVIRNKEMLEKGKPDLVVAFHENLTKSKGTKNMIMQAKAQGVPIKVFGRKKD
jgi:hypothetical protein